MRSGCFNGAQLENAHDHVFNRNGGGADVQLMARQGLRHCCLWAGAVVPTDDFEVDTCHRLRTGSFHGGDHQHGGTAEGHHQARQPEFGGKADASQVLQVAPGHEHGGIDALSGHDRSQTRNSVHRDVSSSSSSSCGRKSTCATAQPSTMAN